MHEELNKEEADQDKALKRQRVKALKESQAEPPPTAWNVLESLIGTVEGPEDWSEQLDHYLHGTPKS